MVRNLLTIVVVAGLVYGAYLINEKFFKSAPASTQNKAADIPATMVSFICAQDVQAFDPASPDKTLGYFKKGTEIKVGGESGVPGMKIVAYQPPDGAVIHAICKASELTSEKNSASIAATAPLEKKMTITTKAPGVSTWLGNGQMTINQNGSGGGAGSSSTIKMGGTASTTKSIGQTFGDAPSTAPSPTAPPVAKTPEQGIKDKAKDLQNPQTP